MKKIIILILLSLAFVGCEKKEEIIVEKDTGKAVIIEDQNVGNIIIKDTNIAYYDNFSNVALTLSNENNTDAFYTDLTINFYSEDNILIYKRNEKISTIKGKTEEPLYFKTDVDLSNVKKVVYEIK